MHRWLFPSLVCLCLPISSAPVDWIRKLIVQIPVIDATIMGYGILGQMRNMMRSIMCKSVFRRGEKILSRVLMMPCAVFLRAHLRSTRSIDLLGSGRGRVDVLGYAI